MPNLSSMRVVSSAGDSVHDVTAAGLRVGIANGEERLALIRPVFAQLPQGLESFSVVDAVVSSNNMQASFRQPSGQWGAGTPPDQVFAMKSASPGAADPAYFRQVFQKLFDSGNNPTASLGFLLTGAGNFIFQNNTAVTFDVTLEVPFEVTIHTVAPFCSDPRMLPPPPAPQPIVPFFMDWTTTRSGTAQISVNGVSVFSNNAGITRIRAQGLRRIRTLIPVQRFDGPTLLVRGDNVLDLTVEPDGLPATMAVTTTSVTVTIADILCPWNPNQ